MTQLYFLKPDTTIDTAALTTLLPLVSPARRQRLEQRLLHSEKSPVIGQKLSLYAELLLRCIATQQLHVENSALVFARGEHGKPYLNGFGDFHFNWSHTKDALVLAVSDLPVGVDVERIRPSDEKLAKRFFTEAEAAYVTEGADRDARFFQIWTRKEAYNKYTGSGLSVPLNAFDVLTDAAIAPLLHTKTHSEYVISLCAKHAEYRLMELTEDTLVSSAHKLSPIRK